MYIDTYVLFNFWLNLWVLFLCRFFAQSSVKNIKILFTAFLLAVGEAMILCIPGGNSVVKIILGLGGLTTLAVYLLFRPGSKVYLYRLLIYAYLAICIVGSGLILFERLGGKRKSSMISLGVMVAFLVIIAEKWQLKLMSRNDFCQVTLTFSEGEKLKLIALVDSGNGLIEPISKVPVSVVEGKRIEPYKSKLREDKFRMIPFRSVGEERGIMEAYFIEKMEIKNDGENKVIHNPIIAISKGALSANEKYQMILHPKILKYGGRNCDT